MAVLYKLPSIAERSPEARGYYSVAEAQDDLDEHGSDTTKRLFRAAQIAFELNHAKNASSPQESETMFLLVLSAMRKKQVVLAGETEDLEDIAAVGSYEYPWFSFGKLARISELAVLPGHQKNGIGSDILRHIEADVAAQGAKEVHLQALTTARTFYVRNGYIGKAGKLYDMYKDLSTT